MLILASSVNFQAQAWLGLVKTCQYAGMEVRQVDFSKKYNFYAPNTRKKAKCVAEGTMYQNQLFHPYTVANKECQNTTSLYRDK